jgi:hypothetical protein
VHYDIESRAYNNIVTQYFRKEGKIIPYFTIAYYIKETITIYHEYFISGSESLREMFFRTSYIIFDGQFCRLNIIQSRLNFDSYEICGNRLIIFVFILLMRNL